MCFPGQSSPSDLRDAQHWIIRKNHNHVLSLLLFNLLYSVCLERKKRRTQRLRFFFFYSTDKIFLTWRYSKKAQVPLMSIRIFWHTMHFILTNFKIVQKNNSIQFIYLLYRWILESISNSIKQKKKEREEKIDWNQIKYSKWQ